MFAILIRFSNKMNKVTVDFGRSELIESRDRETLGITVKYDTGYVWDKLGETSRIAALCCRTERGRVGSLSSW